MRFYADGMKTRPFACWGDWVVLGAASAAVFVWLTHAYAENYVQLSGPSYGPNSNANYPAQHPCPCWKQDKCGYFTRGGRFYCPAEKLPVK